MSGILCLVIGSGMPETTDIEVGKVVERLVPGAEISFCKRQDRLCARGPLATEAFAAQVHEALAVGSAVIVDTNCANTINEMPWERERLVVFSYLPTGARWLTDDELERVRNALATGIMHPSDVLRSKGLWA